MSQLPRKGTKSYYWKSRLFKVSVHFRLTLFLIISSLIEPYATSRGVRLLDRPAPGVVEAGLRPPETHLPESDIRSFSTMLADHRQGNGLLGSRLCGRLSRKTQS